MEQGKELSKDSVSAGDCLSLSPRGAQSMGYTGVVPFEAKGLTFAIPRQSVICQVGGGVGGQGDLQPRGRWELRAMAPIL